LLPDVAPVSDELVAVLEEDEVGVLLDELEELVVVVLGVLVVSDVLDVVVVVVVLDDVVQLALASELTVLTACWRLAVSFELTPLRLSTASVRPPAAFVAAPH
jgi:hypothetical protein